MAFGKPDEESTKLSSNTEETKTSVVTEDAVEEQYMSPGAKDAAEGKKVVFPMPQNEQKAARAAIREEAEKKAALEGEEL